MPRAPKAARHGALPAKRWADAEKEEAAKAAAVAAGVAREAEAAEARRVSSQRERYGTMDKGGTNINTNTNTNPNPNPDPDPGVALSQ